MPIIPSVVHMLFEFIYETHNSYTNYLNLAKQYSCLETLGYINKRAPYKL